MAKRSSPDPRRDEADSRLADAAATFTSTVESVLPGWVERAIIARSGFERFENDSLLYLPTHQAQVDALRIVLPALRTLLRTSPDRQRTSPIEVLQKAVPFPTRVLSVAGIEPPTRSAARAGRYPADLYDLMPESAGEFDEALISPVESWRKVRAEVRQLIVGGASDEMQSDFASIAIFAPRRVDRSTFIKTMTAPEWLVSAADIAACQADALVVDLSRLEDPTILADVDPWCIGYAPSEMPDFLDAGRSVGCDEVIARDELLRRLLAEGLLRHG